MTSTTELAEAIREAIWESEHTDRAVGVDITATEDELVAAITAVWPHDWDYAEVDEASLYDDGVSVWDVWGWTPDTPVNDQEWRITVESTQEA